MPICSEIYLNSCCFRKPFEANLQNAHYKLKKKQKNKHLWKHSLCLYPQQDEDGKEQNLLRHRERLSSCGNGTFREIHLPLVTLLSAFKTNQLTDLKPHLFHIRGTDLRGVEAVSRMRAWNGENGQVKRKERLPPPILRPGIKRSLPSISAARP